MVREILGIELNDLDHAERYRAITYSWASFNSRSQFTKNKERKKKGIVLKHHNLEVFEKSVYSPEFLNQHQSRINVSPKTKEVIK